jgi:hypothetical protein
LAKTNVNLALEPALMALIRNAAKGDQTALVNKLRQELKLKNAELGRLRKLEKRMRTEEKFEADKVKFQKAARKVAAEATEVINRIKALKNRKLQTLMNPKAWYQSNALGAAKTRLLNAAREL